MSILEAVLFGLIQAATEFLPVSSTAHLLVFGELLGRSLDEPLFRAFVAVIQSGTALAVLLYFRADLWRILRAVLTGLRYLSPLQTPDARLGWLIVLGTVPAVALGLAFERRIEALGNWVIAGSLIILGLVLFAAERMARHVRTVESIGVKDAALVGLAQALALIPGSSRSGSTLTMGMLLGFTREAAARFSFLLSVPIILGAGLYKLVKVLPVLRGHADWQLATAVGTLVSFLAGYLVIGWLLGWLRTRPTYLFVAWRIAAGVAIAVLISTGVLPAS